MENNTDIKEKMTDQIPKKEITPPKLPNKVDADFERSNAKYHRSSDPWD